MKEKKSKEPKFFQTEGPPHWLKHGEHTLISYRIGSVEELIDTSAPGDRVMLEDNKEISTEQLEERLEYFYNSKRENASLDIAIILAYKAKGGEETCNLCILEAFDRILGLSEEDFQKEKERDAEASLIEERAHALRMVCQAFVAPMIKRELEKLANNKENDGEEEDFNAFDTST